MPARARRAVVCVDDEWGRRLCAAAPARRRRRDATPPRRRGLARRRGARAAAAAARSALHGPDGVDVAVEVAHARKLQRRQRDCWRVAPPCAPGSSRRRAAAGISACPASPGGWSASTTGAERGLVALVDYAHTPDAVERAVQAARPGAAGRSWSWSAPAVTATAASAPTWAGSPPRAPTSSSSPTTTRARRTRPPSAPPCVDGRHRRGRGRGARGRPTGGTPSASPSPRAEPGDVGARAGQGPRAGTGGRRAGAPVRRPGRAARGARGGTEVIATTLAQVAAATGAGSPETLPGDAVVTAGRDRLAPGRHGRPVRRDRRRAPRRARPRRRRHRRRRGGGARVHDHRHPGAARRRLGRGAGPAGHRRAVPAAGRRPGDGRRHHRLGRQDEHQGPARPGPGPLGPTVAATGSYNNEIGLPADGAAAATSARVTWCSSWGRAGPATSAG